MDIPFGGGGVYKCCLQMDTKLQWTVVIHILHLGA